MKEHQAMIQVPSGGEDTPPLLSVVTTTDPKTGYLPELVLSLSNLAKRNGWTLEIVIVDDLKQWADPEEARAFAETSTGTEARIRTLWYPEHRGQLPAIHAGIRASAGRAIVILDPDLHGSVDALPEMLEQWRSGCLLVHGHRTQRPDIGPLRRAGTLVINGLLRRITRLPVHDFGSPVTLFCASIKPTLDSMPAGITNSRLYAYSRFSNHLCEVPIAPRPRGARQSHYGLMALTRIFFRLLIQARRVRRYTKAATS